MALNEGYCVLRNFRSLFWIMSSFQFVLSVFFCFFEIMARMSMYIYHLCVPNRNFLSAFFILHEFWQISKLKVNIARLHVVCRYDGRVRFRLLFKHWWKWMGQLLLRWKKLAVILEKAILFVLQISRIVRSIRILNSINGFRCGLDLAETAGYFKQKKCLKSA